MKTCWDFDVYQSFFSIICRRPLKLDHQQYTIRDGEKQGVGNGIGNCNLTSEKPKWYNCVLCSIICTEESQIILAASGTKVFNLRMMRERTKDENHSYKVKTAMCQFNGY